VRAALIDLTGEGLVRRVHNRGARVRVVSLAEAVAIVECRQMLEALCAAKAAHNVTEAAATELTEAANGCARRVRCRRSGAVLGVERQLHQRVRELAEQPVATDLLERLNAQMVRHQFRLALRPGGRSGRCPSTWPSSTRSSRGTSGPPRPPRAPTWPACSTRCGRDDQPATQSVLQG